MADVVAAGRPAKRPAKRPANRPAKRPANRPSPSSTPHNAAPPGTKRAAESSPEHEQRLSKRFDLLDLGTRTPAPGLPAVLLTNSPQRTMAAAST